MDKLSSTELLTLWEKGTTLATLQRALLLLDAAHPEESWTALAQQSMGQRNTRLLNLRAKFFGAQFVSMATCPQCDEQLELNFHTADIQTVQPDRQVEALTVDMAGYLVEFRLPTSVDMAAVMDYHDRATIQQVLLERCLFSAKQDGEEISVGALPVEVIEAIAASMEEADPQANIQLSLTCPECGHQWQALLDIVTYLWRELDAWARRILQEVHCLASAYGWHERDILNMSTQRRQIYLRMIGQ